MNLDAILEFLGGIDLNQPLPDPTGLLEKLPLVLKLLVMAGPVLMMVMGALYFFAAPKEANHHFGYRCYFGMGSVEAWQYTQHIAGLTWMGLGLLLSLGMLLVLIRFTTLGLMDMLVWAVVCLLIQAAALLLASLMIRIFVTCRFDRHGRRRNKKSASQEQV